MRRRNFLQLLGIAPIAAPKAAAAVVPELIGKLGTTTAALRVPKMSVLDSLTISRDIASATTDDTRLKLREELITALYEVDRQREARRDKSAGPFDPNISCLKSLSLGAKVRKQMAEDADMKSLMDGAYELFAELRGKLDSVE